MLELLQNVQAWIEVIAYISLGLVVIGTSLAKLTPTKKDDEFVVGAESIVDKVVKFLPTLGVNPRTQALEDELKRLKEQK